MTDEHFLFPNSRGDVLYFLSAGIIFVVLMSSTLKYLCFLSAISDPFPSVSSQLTLNVIDSFFFPKASRQARQMSKCVAAAHCQQFQCTQRIKTASRR